MKTLLRKPGCFSMESQKIEELKAVIAHNLEHGYEHLTNFDSLLCCLDSKDSQVRRLFLEIRLKRKKIDDLNWLCIGIGAINYFANRDSPDCPADHLDSCEAMENLVTRNWEQIRELLEDKSNNPTVPQRAMPFACFCPIKKTFETEKIAVVEFGCSRGDIGLVWLNAHEFLKQSKHFFFPNWIDEVPAESLQNCQEIDMYLGVDIELSAGQDDQWLLALWGFNDPRRESLRLFYRGFNQEQRMKLINADAINLESYRTQLENFTDETCTDHLVFITSYMLYQLTPKRRRSLARHILKLSNAFKLKKGKSSQTCWLNQGIAPKSLLCGDIAFDEIYLTKLRIENCILFATPLAKLKDDTAQGWTNCQEPEVKLGSIG